MTTLAGMLPGEARERRRMPPASSWERRVASFSSAVGLAMRAGVGQGLYSLTHVNVHFQNVSRELDRLAAFLRTHGVVAQSAMDVGCGDGAITVRLRDLLGLGTIWGVERNARLAAMARTRGVRVIEADMECMRTAPDCDLVISYGSLHHAADIRACIRTLAAHSMSYVLIVDNTVRATPFHRVTGSAWFPLELSPYRIRTAEEIACAMRTVATLMAVETFRNANIWHDRSFFLARR